MIESKIWPPRFYKLITLSCVFTWNRLIMEPVERK